jgi:hypothetical protein
VSVFLSGIFKRQSHHCHRAGFVVNDREIKEPADSREQQESLNDLERIEQ